MYRFATNFVLAVAIVSSFAGCNGQKSGKATTTGPAPNPATEAGAIPTDAEALAYAKQLELAVASGTAIEINSLIDWDVLLNTVTANVDVDKRFRKGYVDESKRGIAANGIAHQLAKNSADGGSLELIRVHEVDGEKRALFRLLLPDGGLNYNDMVLAKTQGGVVRTVDDYVFMSAEKLTETLRRLYLTGAAGQSRSILEKLRKSESDMVKHFGTFSQMAINLRNGSFQTVLDLYDTLPDSLKKEKASMLVRLQAAAQVDDTLYSNAIADFRSLYPNDPSLDLLSIDYYVLKEDFAESIACVDRLDELVKDPYLNTVRARVLVAAGDFPAARRAAQQAVDDMPDNENVHWSMLDVLLTEGKFDEMVDWMNKMEQQFQLEWFDLGSVPEYAEFVKSPAYQRWIQSR